MPRGLGGKAKNEHIAQTHRSRVCPERRLWPGPGSPGTSGRPRPRRGARPFLRRSGARRSINRRSTRWIENREGRTLPGCGMRCSILAHGRLSRRAPCKINADTSARPCSFSPSLSFFFFLCPLPPMHVHACLIVCIPWRPWLDFAERMSSKSNWEFKFARACGFNRSRSSTHCFWENSRI